jgi:hypothetical protein
VPCEDGGSLQNMRRLIVSTCEALILGIPSTKNYMLPVPDFACFSTLSTVIEHNDHARRKKEMLIVISVPSSDLGVGTVPFSRTTVEASLGLDHGATLKSSHVSHGPVGF